MKGVGFVRNDSAVLWIEQAVAQFFFSIEGEVILALHGIRENRYVKGRMRTDREVHGFLRFVYNFPGDGQITFVKCMRDVELEDIWQCLRVSSVDSSRCVTDVSVLSVQINSISRANPC